MRTALKLQEYDYNPIYIKGETNIADILSRPSGGLTINTAQTEEIDEKKKLSILENYHQLLGHGSAANMKFIIKDHYNWEGIHSKIDTVVKKCSICSRAGESLINSKNRVIATSFPNELWEIDLIGRIPDKKGRNDFIFIAIDHYTKWMETRRLRSKCAIEVLNAIKDLIINKHGIPKRILSDKGLEFRNEQISKLCKDLNFEWNFSSPQTSRDCWRSGKSQPNHHKNS